MRYLLKDVFYADEKEKIVFGNNKITLKFEKERGNWIECFLNESKLNLISSGISSVFVNLTDKNLQDFLKDGVEVNENYLQKLGNFPYISHSFQSNNESVTLIIISRRENLYLNARYTLHPDSTLVARDVELVYTGAEVTKLRDICFNLSSPLIGSPKDCLFEIPDGDFRPRTPYLEQVKKRMFWDMCDMSPCSFPGILAIHNPKLKLSIFSWNYSEKYGTVPFADGMGERLNFIHQLNMSGYLKKGNILNGGTNYVEVVNGDWDSALRHIGQKIEIVPPDNVPPWTKEMAVNVTHPAVFVNLEGMTKNLGYIKEIGANTIDLIPVTPTRGNEYAAKDYYAVRNEPTEGGAPPLGSEKDLKLLVKEAHKVGIKVLFELVTFGCDKDNVFFKEHPEWRIYGEDGKVYQPWHDFYVHLELADKNLQQFFIDWCVAQIKRYNIDGFFIDAPMLNKFPNWGPEFPYLASTNGILQILKQVRKEIKKIKPEAILLSEVGGPALRKICDVCCDVTMQLAAISEKMKEGKFTGYDLSLWFKDKRTLYSGQVIGQLAYTANQNACYLKSMMPLLKAFIPLTTFLKGAPQIYYGHGYSQRQEGPLENGSGTFKEWNEFYIPFYKSLLKIKEMYPQLIYGEEDFDAVKTDNENIFSCLRRLDKDGIVVLINFSPNKQKVNIKVTPPDPQKEYQMFNVCQKEERRRIPPGNSIELHLEMEGYGWHVQYLSTNIDKHE